MPDFSRAFFGVLLSTALVLPAGVAMGQSTICPDGEHFHIDVKELSLEYEGWSLAGTLSSLTALSSRVDIGKKTLQEAADATPVPPSEALREVADQAREIAPDMIDEKPVPVSDAQEVIEAERARMHADQRSKHGKAN